MSYICVFLFHFLNNKIPKLFLKIFNDLNFPYFPNLPKNILPSNKSSFCLETNIADTGIYIACYRTLISNC